MSLKMRADSGKRVELEQYVSILLSACVDYRNLLIRANVPDSVSGRHEGVENICTRFGVKVKQRSLYGEKINDAVIKRSED